MTTVLDDSRQYDFATFYQFTNLHKLSELREQLLSIRPELLGLIIIAKEGINGTIAGSRENVNSFIEYIQSSTQFQNLELKFSKAVLTRMPFRKLKIKIKKEIVTFGVDDLDVQNFKGSYVEPSIWNNYIQDPDVFVLDARNVYEYRIGSFQDAHDSKTMHFGQFPKKIKKILSETRSSKVAMFCTGGIRCEKASAYIKQQLGIQNVYQLHGGILKYFEVVPTKDCLWNGKCFVFDGRITLNSNLEAHPEPLCKVCGQVMLLNPETNNYTCYQCIEYPLQKTR